MHNSDKLEQLAEIGLRSLFPARTKIRVGMATCGRAAGAESVLVCIREEVEKRKLDCIVSSTGCLGFCEREPLVDIVRPGWPRVVYAQMNVEKACAVVSALAEERILPEFALCKIPEERDVAGDSARKYAIESPPAGIEKVQDYYQTPFFSKQEKRILLNCGLIDPDSIEEYIARGGYSALRSALTGFQPAQIIQQVTKSGLRGRGGAGFPTGKKWDFCCQAQGEPKYVICNADEGDPGAYMDRSILEGNPHSVFEGMIIGAYAIGAGEGIVYVRAEYPLAIKKLEIALAQALEHGFLGNNILGSGFDFLIHIERGSGAFVCGEETALIASIESSAGEPRQRPPFPAQCGLWGKPTNINNVKTWANIPLIIAHGADWFSRVGTETSKGTMVFSLVGKVKNTGLVEVPMGTALSTLVHDVGGGIAGDRNLKAIQTGGPSGGCIPARLAHLSADYETLTKAGSIMGSGGMVVMDERTCMVDVAKYFLTFARDESCGKCNPCREGTRRMLEILTDITEGRGREGDVELLEEMSRTIIDSSLCGLGGTAPNPVLTTIRYFRDEYEAHIKFKRCPGVICRKIISSPCQHVCPLGTDVPAYVTLIARRQFKEAHDVIRKTNPLVSVCGRVCHHPCEAVCASGDGGGDPIAIRALKRFVSDYYESSQSSQECSTGILPVEPGRGLEAHAVSAQPRCEKVAIIGSGPAGLTAAYYLAREGYEVAVFEAMPEPGGMLRYAIPEYRLPQADLAADVEFIKAAGVTIKTNTCIGKDVSFADLKQQGFKAVIIAVGAWKNLKLGIPGEDTAGVVNPLEFLKSMRTGKPVELGRRVVVIGGGNVAVDTARTAWRLGRQVTILYRRTRNEMPASEEEIEEVVSEKIPIQFLTTPVRVIADGNNRATGLECVKMQLGEPDASGRRRPEPVNGSEFTIEADAVIPAIGQEPDLSFLPEARVTERRTLEVNLETLATGLPGVFAGGDVVLGPATVTQAMAQGKLAADFIHKYLRGEDMTPRYEVTRPTVDVEPLKLSDAEQEALLDARRARVPGLPLTARSGNFEEVELSYSEELAVSEAKRCLRCDRR
jgi:NADH-quinone oxidoreductase subunit F